MLFGLGAPFGKLLVAEAGPVALAAVFYLSAGLSLALLRGRSRGVEAPIQRTDAPLLLVVAVLGGIVGPVLMLHGLRLVPGVTGALLLNLEAPFTMLLAVTLFGEHLGRRELSAAGVVVGGAALLGLAPGTEPSVRSAWGIAALAGATLCWGLDNNLSQRLSLRDPIAVVRVKALSAGTGNLLIALWLGDRFPVGPVLLAAIAVGIASYGLSILLDAYALRHVGAAREAAYFATAPFFGALVAVPLLGETLTGTQLAAGGLMGLGVIALLRERHAHEHVHEALTHEHLHAHDEHHRHAHALEPPAGEHSHPHTHEPIEHQHPHVSDAHHRHRH
jgi:drug/metabolite transporter (DMT)-like permease